MTSQPVNALDSQLSTGLATSCEATAEGSGWDETVLRVPIHQAVELGERLDLALGRAAEKDGLDGYDDGEEMGEWYVYFFGDASIDDVAGAVTPVVTKMIKGASVSVTGERELTVQLRRQPQAWLRWLGTVEHPYDRAVRREIKRIVADPAWEVWRISAGLTLVEVQEADAAQARELGHAWSIGVDDGKAFIGAKLPLSILDSDQPTTADVRQAAEANVAEVLQRLSAYLHQPLPAPDSRT